MKKAKVNERERVQSNSIRLAVMTDEECRPRG